MRGHFQGVTKTMKNENEVDNSREQGSNTIMDQEIKAKWLAALRSGEYKQGSGGLRNKNDGFCCLGVLCDIHPDVSWSEPNDYEARRAVYKDGDDHHGYLPEKFAKEVGLRPGRGRSFELDVAQKNDAGVPFTEIADWIEEHL